MSMARGIAISTTLMILTSSPSLRLNLPSISAAASPNLVPSVAKITFIVVPPLSYLPHSITLLRKSLLDSMPAGSGRVYNDLQVILSFFAAGVCVSKLTEKLKKHETLCLCQAGEAAFFQFEPLRFDFFTHFEAAWRQKD